MIDEEYFCVVFFLIKKKKSENVPYWTDSFDGKESGESGPCYFMRKTGQKLRLPELTFALVPELNGKRAFLHNIVTGIS